MEIKKGKGEKLVRKIIARLDNVFNAFWLIWSNNRGEGIPRGEAIPSMLCTRKIKIVRWKWKISLLLSVFIVTFARTEKNAIFFFILNTINRKNLVRFAHFIHLFLRFFIDAAPQVSTTTTYYGRGTDRVRRWYACVRPLDNHEETRSGRIRSRLLVQKWSGSAGSTENGANRRTTATSCNGGKYTVQGWVVLNDCFVMRFFFNLQAMVLRALELPLVIPPTILFVLCVFVLISQCCGIGKNKVWLFFVYN